MNVLQTIELSEQTVNMIMLILWLSVFVFSLIIEVSTAELASVWFCGGALAALIFTYIPGVPFYVEIIVFFVVSIALLLSLRPVVMRAMKKRKGDSLNVEAVIGRKGTILKDVTELEPGEVRIESVIWTCMSKNNEELKVGDIVIVDDIVGNRLYVSKVKGE